MRNIFTRTREPRLSRGTSFVVGIVGSVAGMLAMRAYWDYVAPLVNDMFGKGRNDLTETPNTNAMDDISVVGQQHKADESSTDAIARMAYKAFTGSEPDDHTKSQLSSLVHWIYGLGQGGMYGAFGSPRSGISAIRGPLFGLGLWLLGDEITVPLLGLQAGPTAVSPAQHINRLGAHVAYGAATAVATDAARTLLKHQQ